MSAARWPVARGDGSVSVAVRFGVATQATRDALVHAVAMYVDRKAAVDQVDLLDDLWELPHVETSDSSVDVVFDGRPRSKWKDWVVEFTREAEQSVTGAPVLGFFDRVAERLRPVHR